MRKGEVKAVQVRGVENGYQVHATDGDLCSPRPGLGYVAVDDEHLIAVIKEILGVE